MKNCNEYQELLVGYLEGLLDEETRQELESHIQQCSVCKAELDESIKLHTCLEKHSAPFTQKSLDVLVMDKILQQPFKRRKQTMWKRYGKLGIGLAAAAAIVFAVFAGWGFFGTTKIAAAELLREIAAKNTTYAGWVHITFDEIPDAMQPKGGPKIHVKGSSLHLNTESNIFVKVVEFDNSRTLEWIDATNNITKSFSSITNEIVINHNKFENDPKELFTEQLRKMLQSDKKKTAWQIGQMLFAIPTVEGISALVDYGWCNATYKQEGSYDRFDLTLNKEKAEYSGDASQPFLTLLVDHQTNLIYKWKGIFDNVPLSVTFKYGTPVFTDICDIGIPANATVIDNSSIKNPDISPEAEAVLERLNSRVGKNENLGDYVAIITESKPENLNRGWNIPLRIFARNGTARFYGLYNNQNLISKLMKNNNWPYPEINSVLELSQDFAPNVLFITNGEKGWWSRGSDMAHSTTTLTMESVETFLAGSSLSGELWPGKHRIDYQHLPRINIKIDTMISPDHSNLIGFHVNETGFNRIFSGMGDRNEQTYWIDPMRQDLPVERIDRSYSSDGKSIEVETVTRYSDYNQLPNGTWYPTHWNIFITMNLNGQTQKGNRDYYLQIFPNMRLDPIWFSDPIERFGTSTSQTQPSQK